MEHNKHCRDQNIEETLEKNFMPYAMSIIISRAIPEIDGFKPSHRKLLYTMYKMGLLNGNRTKSANIVGQTMKLNPHGDSAIYETMVRLTRANEALLLPLVDSKGNFGKQYSRDMAYAASRYTEAKLDSVCAEIFGEIDKDTVDFVDNYDSSTTEPVLLPTTFPNILVNPNQGIAVGMASNMASFNLREVCAATIAYMNDANCDILDYMISPDFSTGANIIYDKAEMRAIYESGRGGIKIRSTYMFDQKNSCVEITQIPYTTTIEAITEKIIEHIKNGKLKEISDIRDESDLSGLKLTIDVKKNTDVELLMQRLFKTTPLQDTYSCNFNLLINGRPIVLGVKEIIREWVDFRIGCIERSIRYDLVKKRDKLHLLEGLKKILLDIDKAISIVRNTELDSMVIPNLMEGFSIDKVQADFIAEIKLRNLNKEYILKRTEEIDALMKDIKALEETLKSPAKIKNIIKSDLNKISKKYGIDRKTKIVHAHEITHIAEEKFIADYNLRLFLTKENYLKKITLASLRASSNEHKLKDEDAIVQEIECSNKCELLILTDKQNLYKHRVYDIADSKISSLGEYLPNLLNMENGERAVYMIATTDYAGSLVLCFENGKINKIPISVYETKNNRKRLTNAYYGGVKLIGMHWTAEENDFAIYSAKSRAIVFSSEIIPLKNTKTAQGIQVMSCNRGNACNEFKPLTQTGILSPNYYRVKNIPVIGKLLKDEDKAEKQLKLFDE